LAGTGDESKAAGTRLGVRTGSPFADRAPSERAAILRRVWNGPAASAWVALMLTIYAAGAMAFSHLLALCLVLAALPFGIAGLWGRRRALALASLAAACLVLLVSGFFVAVQTFEWQYGYKPFEAQSEFDELEPVDELEPLSQP
jgi:hypothetical protein